MIDINKYGASIFAGGISFLNNTHKRIFTRVRHPFSLFNIELTNKCPMKCIMCARTYAMTRPLGFMNVSLFEDIIDQLCSMQGYRRQEILWLHHFGESLLHPQFDYCIKYAEERGLTTGLSVNPLLFNDDISGKLLLSGLSCLYASLDGYDNETFELIRGLPNSFDRSSNNLKLFAEQKYKTASKMKLIVSIIDLRMNMKNLTSRMEYWKTVKGIDNVIIKQFTRWSGDNSEINRLDPKIAQRSKSNEQICCFNPWRHMSVCWDGVVVPCCYDCNKAVVLGNVNTSSLQTIWNDKPIRRLRSEFASGRVINPLCRNCPEL